MSNSSVYDLSKLTWMSKFVAPMPLAGAWNEIWSRAYTHVI